jgi:hypothetical protein
MPQLVALQNVSINYRGHGFDNISADVVLELDQILRCRGGQLNIDRHYNNVAEGMRIQLRWSTTRMPMPGWDLVNVPPAMDDSALLSMIELLPELPCLRAAHVQLRNSSGRTCSWTVLAQLVQAIRAMGVFELSVQDMGVGGVLQHF